MITPSSFAIHVTYTCPLACAHCCFSSSPKNRDRLPIEMIMATIERVAETDVQMIAFTGGEPFLLRENLSAAVKLAKQRGLTTRVVSSAHWATSAREAKRRLAAFDGALDELSVSWDDYHEEFVAFDNVRHAFNAALELSIEPAVCIVQSASSRWTAARVRSELGLALDSTSVIVESPLNVTGRATEELADAPLRPVRTLGPCPYVLTGPTLSAKGKLLACCGVIQETDALVIDPAPTPDTLLPSIETAQKSVLLNWLFLRGPYQIMQWMGERYGIAIPDAAEIGGNCEACRRLFEMPALQERMSDALEEHATPISDELHLLDALGMLKPSNILDLWRDQSCVMDVTPTRLMREG